LLKSIIGPVFYRVSYQSLVFITGLFVARIAGPELFGIISLMIVNTAVFIILTDFGTGAAVIWHGAGNEIQPARLFSFAASSGAVQLFLFLAVEFVVIKISGRTLLTQQRFNSSYFFDEIIYFLGLVLAEKYTSLFYGRGNAALANRTFSTITAFFLIIFILVYARVIKGVHALDLFCSMFLALGVGEAIVFHVWIQRISFLKPAAEELKSLMSFSVIVFVANIIQFLAYRLDFWLIDHYYTAADVGIYAQSNRFAQLIWLLPIIISALLPPLMRGENSSFDDEAFLQLLRILNFITVVIVVSVIVIAIAFYHWFFQNEYSRGLSALLLMLPGYFLFATATLLAAWFSVKRLLKINLIGSCLCFVVILAADLILIPRNSLDGAGLANTIAYSITTLYFILQFRRHKSVAMKELFLCKKEDIIVIKRLIS